MLPPRRPPVLPPRPRSYPAELHDTGLERQELSAGREFVELSNDEAPMELGSDESLPMELDSNPRELKDPVHEETDDSISTHLMGKRSEYENVV